MNCAKCHRDFDDLQAGLCPGCHKIVAAMRDADPVMLHDYMVGRNGKSATTPANLFTVQEAAERLSVSVRTVYRLIESGELPHTKIGTSVRIKPAALERYLAHQSRSSGSLFG